MLDLFKKENDADAAWAIRNTGADLPTWWDWHGGQVWAGLAILVACVLLAVLMTYAARRLTPPQQ